MLDFVAKITKELIALLLGLRFNRTIALSKKQYDLLLKGAKKSVQIVTGELQSEIFDDNDILSKLENLSTREKNPVSIEIIHGPGRDPRSSRILQLQHNARNGFSIMQAPSRPKFHFMLVDGKRYRIEKYHSANSVDRIAYAQTRTGIFFNRMLADRFKDLKASCSETSKRVS